jgi:membrane associated rhomboid family serine protease
MTNLLRMFLPIRLVGKNNFRAYTTFFILIAYMLVFAWEVFITTSGGQPIQNYLPQYALTSCEIGVAPVEELVIDSVRGLFMTDSFVIMLINMLFLWIFGPLVEEFLGTRRYLMLFVLAGVAGFAGKLLLSGIMNSADCTPLYGPNGAISGVIAAFVFLYPQKRVETALRPLLDRRFDLPAFFFAIIYLTIQFFVEEGGPLSGNFAPVWDEIIGFATGFVIIFAITMFKPAPKVDPLEFLDREE